VLVLKHSRFSFWWRKCPPVTGATETWNGTAWTEVNDLNIARNLAGAGTNTAALAFGGNIPQDNSIHRRMVRTRCTNSNYHRFLRLDYYITIYISLFIINGYIESTYDREERH
jgi:hypothetical protein